MALRESTRGAVLLAGVFLLSGPPVGTAYALPPPPRLQGGVWSQSFNLPITPTGDWSEIVHAVVLPPQAPGVAGRYEDMVMLVCARNIAWNWNTSTGCTASGQGYFGGPLVSGQGKTFIWNPGSTGFVAEPTVPNDCRTDLFCGAHLLLKNGDLLWIGGQDYYGSGTNPAGPGKYGHPAAFVFTNSTSSPGWQQYSSLPVDVWYPSPCEREDGNVVVVGHDGCPNGPGCPGAGTETWKTRQLLDLSGPTPVWTGPWDNVIVGTLPTPLCGGTALEKVIGYPRLFLLKSGAVMRAGYEKAAGFLVDLACSVFTPPQEDRHRWVPGADMFSARFDGMAVHLLALDPTSMNPPEYKEVVYAFGGQGAIGSQNNNDLQCTVTAPGVEGTTPSVQKMVDPGPTSAWIDVAPIPDGDRRHATAVMLADGSALIINGEGSIPSPPCPNLTPTTNCCPRLTPWVFRPPEVFNPLNDPGLPGAFPTDPAQWTAQAPHPTGAGEDLGHTYHSVAGLLRTGPVFTGGGHPFPSSGLSSFYRMHLFTPDYTIGRRPVITGAPDTVAYNTIFTMGVSLPAGAGTAVQRVHLIRGPSVSHFFDFQARYVELYVADVVYSLPEPGGGPPTASLSVVSPPDSKIAPPGWYWVFAVDTNGLASEGRWVMVQ